MGEVNAPLAVSNDTVADDLRPRTRFVLNSEAAVVFKDAVFDPIILIAPVEPDTVAPIPDCGMADDYGVAQATLADELHAARFPPLVEAARVVVVSLIALHPH